MKQTIESMSNENRKIPPSKEFRSKAHINSLEQYQELYKKSIENPEEFWAEQAENLVWFKKWDNVFRYTEKPFVKWFEGGKLNVSYNCLDRHLNTWRKNKAAIIWEAEDGEYRTFTYGELFTEVCKFSNVLKSKGIKKGDRVCIYLPMIPELAISMLACARIGAIHSIVFGGFSAESLKGRINDSEAKMLITADGSFRKGKKLPMKEKADSILGDCKSIDSVIVVKRTKLKVGMNKKRDFWWHKELKNSSSKCSAEHMGSEDSLFILYTSGTTGKPKGVLHTQAGYLLYTYLTFKWIFDVREEDTYFCTADIGWITGHSYIVYGPLANGATTIMFEGMPLYPKPDRMWEIVDKYKVSIFYTAPTAIRALAKEGDGWPKKHDLTSLRLLGSVGEPINPEAWMWYYNVIGKKKCPIVDTWWQTETGGILIAPLPGAFELKPGSASKPFFGVDADVFNEEGKEVGVNEGGYLVIKKPWPSMERTIWGDPERYKETYFSRFPDVYFTGDGAKKDEDGDFWLMGRVDDVINISGHRIGTAEVESALVSHKGVAESAVVPIPHDIKGQSLYAFVILKKGYNSSDELKKELIQWISKEIGPIAKPEKLQFTDALPKTRSGKIMRRILKAIAEGKDDVGDTTTLADSSVVETLIKERE
ncbi:acetate--CoA ligase [Candidatus Woesearchaeota archaeon]|nr:acetate--CoA ligase [Candidatus Woesearchaeota archaeon]